MATTTTNLSLRKPESTDFVSVALDISGNMQTIDDKWASSAAADIGSAAAAGSALTVARTDHVHKVGSGTVGAPGLPIGEATSGFYRIGSGNIGASIAGALAWAFSAAGISLEAMLSLKKISTPASPASGYVGLYSKSDDNLYKLTSAGDEVKILDADIVTTAGDTIYATGAEAPTRLAIGTAYQVLGVNAGATAPEWQAGIKSVLTTTGDVVYASSANTPARLAVGTAVQALGSSGTVPQWVGVPLKIGEATGNGSSGTLEVSSIPATFRSLYIEVYGRGDVAAIGSNVQLTFESSPTAGAYNHQTLTGTATTVAAAENIGASDFILVGVVPGATSTANLAGHITVNIPEYANTTFFKSTNSAAANILDISSGNIRFRMSSGVWESTAAISRVRFTLASGNWIAGSRITVWGLPA